MQFGGKVWRLLVGIKDGLVLVFMLLFFTALFAVLTARPSPAAVRDGALLLDLSGVVVEERTEIDPIAALLSGTAPVGEYQARDVIHALDEAAGDERISAVVLDLDRFLGGGQVHGSSPPSCQRLDRLQRTRVGWWHQLALVTRHRLDLLLEKRLDVDEHRRSEDRVGGRTSPLGLGQRFVGQHAANRAAAHRPGRDQPGGVHVAMIGMDVAVVRQIDRLWLPLRNQLPQRIGQLVTGHRVQSRNGKTQEPAIGHPQPPVRTGQLGS